MTGPSSGLGLEWVPVRRPKTVTDLNRPDAGMVGLVRLERLGFRRTDVLAHKNSKNP